MNSTGRMRVLILMVISMVAVALCNAKATGRDPRKHALTGLAAQKVNVSAEMLIFLEPGTSIRDIESAYGVTHKQTLKSDPHAHIFTAGNAIRAMSVRQECRQDTRVRHVYENRRTHKVKHAFVPDDPYYQIRTNAPWTGYGQWHLSNGVGVIDSNVSGAWQQDLTGLGVTIGIVDDSFETAHPDLAANYSASNSWDFGEDNADPNPVWTDDEHGVSVAGVAAARGSNGVGVVGAAPYASLAGLRLDFNNQTVAMFVDATLYHSSGSTSSIAIKNHSYGNIYSYLNADAETVALDTSTDAGTIHVFSAGNDRGARDADANKKDPQNSPNSITVAALGFDGQFSYYSCFGANIVVTAPSSDQFTTDSILTTDRTVALGYNPGGLETFPDTAYTSLFGGTSSSAPLVAGILALVKQVQPELNTRFAKHLLARTSVMVDPSDTSTESDGGWRTNSAGFRFNQNYGFGLIDASALVEAATQYALRPLSQESTGTIPVGVGIPDDDPTGISTNFTLSSSTPLEELVVLIDIDGHPWENDIEIYVTSPDGHTNRLAKQSYAGNFTNGIDWTFCTHAFWGCNPQGTWTLTVSDRASLDTGTWDDFSVTARMGELVNLVPVFLNVTPTNGNTVLQWSSVSNIAYSLGYSTNLLDGFSVTDSNIPATPAVNVYTDTLHNAAQQFWKLFVEP